MGYRLGRTLESWMEMARQAAPLGPVAIEERVREVARNEAIDVASCVVTDLGKQRVYRVGISHRDVGSDPGHTFQLTAFDVFNYRHNPITDWNEALEAIKVQQSQLPPGMRGGAVNVSEAEYRAQLAQIREATKYTVQLGDFAIWKNAKGLHLVYITRPGEIAFRKWVEVAKIPWATQVYDIGDIYAQDNEVA